MSLENFKKLMKSPENIIHLNNAGMAPLHPSARQATADFDRDQFIYASSDFPLVFQNFHNAKKDIAKFINCPVEGVAWMQNCAHGISQVALGINYKAGQEIISIDQEYPSSIYPWMFAAEKNNIKLHKITSNPDLSINYEKVLDLISPKTRIVALSWVQ